MILRMRKKIEGGFTLIELMIVVAIIGVLAPVAITAFMKYISRSKTTEAMEGVKKIYEGARAYFMEEANSQGSTTPIAKQFPDSADRTPTDKCCSQTGEKCQPDADQWSGAWQSLKFAMEDPHYYQYQYTGSATAFTAHAFGDLDCDDTLSTFEMVGVVGADGAVTGSASFFKDNELE